MLNLFRTKTYLKDYKKIKFSDKLYTKYVLYVSTLLKEQPLPQEALDHQLKGNMKDYRELHISGDLLIIYKIEENTFNPDYVLDFCKVVLMLCNRDFHKKCSFTLLVIQVFLWKAPVVND